MLFIVNFMSALFHWKKDKKLIPKKTILFKFVYCLLMQWLGYISAFKSEEDILNKAPYVIFLYFHRDMDDMRDFSPWEHITL